MANIRKGPPYDRLPTGEFDEDDRKSIQKQLKRQDESLDILGSSAMRLGELSLSISNEINEQNRMLDGLEEDVDRVQSNMDLINKATEKLIKKGGGIKTCGLIVVLSLILIVLIFLVIYT